MQIGFDGADVIGIYCFGELIATIGHSDQMTKEGVCIQYLSSKEAIKKGHHKGDQDD